MFTPLTRVSPIDFVVWFNILVFHINIWSEIIDTCMEIWDGEFRTLWTELFRFLYFYISVVCLLNPVLNYWPEHVFQLEHISWYVHIV